MDEFLRYAIPGIPVGCVYALVAVSLVLTYTTSGVFNLAFGAQAYVSAVVFYLTVVDHGWLTESQFVDGLALGGILPAPLIIFSTFVGYVAGGLAGALAMTVGIFLPAFVFTAILGPLTPWLRRSAALRRAVRMASVAAVAIVVAVTATLAMKVITNPWTLVPVGASALFAARGAGAVEILVAGMFASALVAGLA